MCYEVTITFGGVYRNDRKPYFPTKALPPAAATVALPPAAATPSTTTTQTIHPVDSNRENQPGETVPQAALGGGGESTKDDNDDNDDK